MKSTPTTFICPKCNKQISEYALKCPNCGCAFDLQFPLKADHLQHKDHKKIQKSPPLIFGITLSIFIGSVSLFVLKQSFLAFNVWKGVSTYDRLILFRNSIEMGALKQLTVTTILCSTFLIASIIFTIICVVKLLQKKN